MSWSFRVLKAHSVGTPAFALRRMTQWVWFNGHGIATEARPVLSNVRTIYSCRQERHNRQPTVGASCSSSTVRYVKSTAPWQAESGRSGDQMVGEAEKKLRSLAQDAENADELLEESDEGSKGVSSKRTSSGTPDVHDSPEIAKTIFDSVWDRLERKHGRTNMRFPKELIWLNGAPGSGKGTAAEWFTKERHISHISTSDLLQSPEAQKLKEGGNLVNDTEVLSMLLSTLLQEEHRYGVAVDGFPRTRVQVEFLKLLYDRMYQLHRDHFHTDLSDHFPRPKFHIVMLYIDEEESVRRQMMRGEKIAKHNMIVEETGEGETRERRSTDTDDALARERYRIFRQEGFEPLRALKNLFNYHFVRADGTIQEVRDRIMKEFQYQSSLELADDTYEKMEAVPSAETIGLHYRQNLVRELDSYQARSPDLLDEVIDIIRHEFMPIIRMCVSSGKATIRAYDDVFFEHSKALRMAVAVLSERGFQVSVRKEMEHIPRELEESTHRIMHYSRPYYVFELYFPRGRR